MKTKFKFDWKKLPSVTRENKFFYRAKNAGGTEYTVVQSFLTGNWMIQSSHDVRFKDMEFPTSREARTMVEKVNG